MTQYTQEFVTRRLGLGESVSLHGAQGVTVSLTKGNGAYTAELLISTAAEPNVRDETDWLTVQIQALNTTDVIDAPIPDNATAVATRVTAIAAGLPRLSAIMTIKSNALSGLHQRRRHASGRQDNMGASLFPAPLPKFVPGTALPPNPLHWFDMDDAATIWQDVAGTVPGAVGSTIGRMDNKGSDGTAIVQATAADRPMYLGQVAGGRNALQSASQSVPDGQLLAGNPLAGITINTVGFTQALVVRRRLPTGGAIRHMCGWAGVIFDTSAFGTFRFEYAPNSTDSFPAGGSVADNWYLIYSVFEPPASGTQDKEKFQSGSAPLQRAITTAPTVIGASAELKLGDDTFDGIDLEIAEWIIWPRDITAQERLDLVAHMDEKYLTMNHAFDPL